jgi:diadenylate cyclase
MLQQIQGMLTTISFLDVVDILIVAIVLYKCYLLIKNTRAVALLKGLVMLLFATLVSKWLGLNVINWLLQKTMTMVMVALPIVFQPELRRALEQLGRGRVFIQNHFLNEEETGVLLAEIQQAVEVLAKNKTGALLVFEKETGLSDYMETGVKLEGLVSSELLINIFVPNTPLHDGAVIIRGNRVMAAGCILPLTEERSLAKELGTRHRAAMGLSEQADCLVVVVSEETGAVSAASGGILTRYVDEQTLQKLLQKVYKLRTTAFSDLFSWRTTA